MPDFHGRRNSDGSHQHEDCHRAASEQPKRASGSFDRAYGSAWPQNPDQQPGGGEGFIGAGTREIQNSLSMDGVSIMNNLITTTTFRPSVDAIQETQIQTGTYPAQYGHYMGVQINVITKSGTNALHGAVFHFLRNNILDARGYFENRAISQAPLRQNQFGYALAGPVVLPRLYDGRNRTFFLSNYEGLRNRQAVPTIETVLTPLMRRGDFSEVTTTAIVDPLDPALRPFQGNRIPESRLSPQALRALQYMPLPTGPGIINNYNVNVPNANDGNQLIHRLDHNITQNARWFGRYAWANTDLLNGNSNPFNGYTQPVRDRNLVIGYTQVFSPTIVNDFRAGRQHTRINSENFFTGSNPGRAQNLGFPATPRMPIIRVCQIWQSPVTFRSEARIWRRATGIRTTRLRSLPTRSALPEELTTLQSASTSGA
ncbi:MAG: hypothetical protein WKF37_22015 [Bryobacteraceae bacterium]